MIRSFWEKLTPQQKKGYLILLIINLIYGLTFCFCLLIDIAIGVTIAGIFSFFYLFTIPIYLIFYGIFAYKKTGHIILPNLLLGLCIFVLTILIVIVNMGDEWLKNLTNHFFIIMATIIWQTLSIAAIPMAVSAITKKVTISQQKRLNQTTHPVPPAQPPQEP